LNIIYIDDDPTNRLIVREMLTMGGLNLSEAADGVIGLRMISEGDYGLVLMDLRMPGLNGLTAIRQLRADGRRRRRQHVVVLSGELTDGVTEMCRTAGADDFLPKPVSLGRLMDIVASAISQQEVVIS